MKLFVKDRMMLMQVLPQEGNFVTLLMVRQLQEKVGLTADDHTKLNIRAGTDEKGERVEGTVQWDAQKDEGLDIEFKGPETKLIVEALEKLNKSDKLTVHHLGLCEKFLDTKTA